VSRSSGVQDAGQRSGSAAIARHDQADAQGLILKHSVVATGPLGEEDSTRLAKTAIPAEPAGFAPAPSSALLWPKEGVVRSSSGGQANLPLSTSV
jgi:hypothetical protein